MNSEEDEFKRIEAEAKRRAAQDDDDDTQGYVSEFADERFDVAQQSWADDLNAAPPQREWVGLTPEEILDLFDINNVYGSKWIEFARTVEAKLKERNG